MLLSMFGWIVLSDYVRAEFLRNRALDYVKAARAMGLSNWQIMWRHVLPNSLTPVITFLPFRMSAAILRSRASTSSASACRRRRRASASCCGRQELPRRVVDLDVAFAALVVTLLLLTFMGDALRNALDMRARLGLRRGTTMTALAGHPAVLRALRRESRRAGSEPRGRARRACRARRRVGLGQERDGAVDPAARAARMSGQMLFDGEDLLAKSEQQMRGIRGADIAMVFQEPMTALNPLIRSASRSPRACGCTRLRSGDARERGIALLRRTGIQPERRIDSFPHQLSGGQRQRAMIAMALACRPRLLLADEPTTALDVTVRQQIVDLLIELQEQEAAARGMAVLLITHDLNLVRRFAQRVAVMEQGVLVETNTTAALFAAPQRIHAPAARQRAATRHRAGGGRARRRSSTCSSSPSITASRRRAGAGYSARRRFGPYTT
jgi:ABC-type dipeptide/oligopeptide/nickel transport system ATPase component